VFIAAKDEKIHQNHEAVTDAAGAFRIEGLIPVRFAMSVLHGSGSLRRELVVPKAGEVIETPDLTLEPDFGRVRVVIDRPDDRPGIPEGTEILLVGYGHRVRQTVPHPADPDEKIELLVPPDVYAVVLVRSESVGSGRGRLTRYMSQFAKVEVKARGNHRVTLTVRPK